MKEGDYPLTDVNDEVEGLAGQLEDLIGVCAKLQSENAELRSNRQQLEQDNAHLLDRNREAKHRIDQIIDRLRASGVT